jgi:hypothetical protein
MRGGSIREWECLCATLTEVQDGKRLIPCKCGRVIRMEWPVTEGKASVLRRGGE